MKHAFCAIFIFQTRSRACLKKAFRELRVPVCGRFYPNEGGVAGYVNRIRAKYTAKWGLQIVEMIFQTLSIVHLQSGRCKLQVLFKQMFDFTQCHTPLLSLRPFGLVALTFFFSISIFSFSGY